MPCIPSGQHPAYFRSPRQFATRAARLSGHAVAASVSELLSVLIQIIIIKHIWLDYHDMQNDGILHEIYVT